ncbi:hypothetical protein [Helicobacter sp. 13S00482-2]|uniref:hypothetical protein n=1 Tax=Helicobacter sp. 13S00482-2 TaxID=1476200 RepID=UPI001C5F19F4|nr:hypothetical protein [Helicobacter sp. 13S00482-2]
MFENIEKSFENKNFEFKIFELSKFREEFNVTSESGSGFRGEKGEKRREFKVEERL